ncbi:hypothetical protein K9L97_01530 [Candidatus Woesearchaeota archaeon]|nr:hypothetical protein [Candidatus Woesearchaeota archaeon]
MTYKTDLEKREKAVINAIKESYGKNATILPDPKYAGLGWGKSFIPFTYNFTTLEVYSKGIRSNKTNITIRPKGKIILQSKSMLKNKKINQLKKAIEQKSFICDIINN